MTIFVLVFGFTVLVLLSIPFIVIFEELIKTFEMELAVPIKETKNTAPVSKEENLKSENDRLTSELNAARMELSKYKSYRG